MPSNLNTRLLEVSGTRTNGRRDGHTFQASGARDRGNARRQSTARRTANEDEIVQRRASWKPHISLRRRFLLQLAVALHSYGSSASRTEYLIDKAADRLDVETSVAVFPNLILLSFPGDDESDTNRQNPREASKQKKDKRLSHKNHHLSFESRKEIHMLTVDSDLDVDKLGRVDELANRVGREGTPFLFAYWRLKAIAAAPPEFGKWWRLFGFALSASMSAPLFFDGSPWDAVFSLFLGLAVGILDFIASRSSLFATVLEFTSALLVSFLAHSLSVHLQDSGLCYIAMTLSALVQLLPGMALTLGASEMVAKSHVTGSASIMYGLFSSMQLGFGLAMGENLVWWAGEPVSTTCKSPGLPIWWNLIWFVGYTLASNVLLNARLDQWPGMTLSAFVGYVVSYVTALRLSSSTSSAISAFAVGITGTAYSHFTGDLPLVMILSGILLLVPGGIGVQGVAAMLKEDVSSGVGFVFEMVVVALSLTVGLLIAKLAVPSAHHTNRPISFCKKNLPTLMDEFRAGGASDSDEDEEDMAI